MRKQERWYTREQAAKLLEVSESTVKTEALVCKLADHYRLLVPSKNGKARRDRRVYTMQEIRAMARSRAQRSLRVPGSLLK